MLAPVCDPGMAKQVMSDDGILDRDSERPSVKRTVGRDQIGAALRMQVIALSHRALDPSSEGIPAPKGRIEIRYVERRQRLTKMTTGSEALAASLSVRVGEYRNRQSWPKADIWNDRYRLIDSGDIKVPARAFSRSGHHFARRKCGKARICPRSRGLLRVSGFERCVFKAVFWRQPWVFWTA
ncbi:hypothetical protein [Bosea sp. ANAM02]|uniref:hypothetical protein n=1 Tax=Bosea sp. ANAM02 TaxID=2020412 RepID=UPI00140EB6DB|nr:hypothetical protein [Bosea sp. ANAM02]BCB20418.1 hypothetical protein OCUBac02_33120 [Bosea sp. ANAM02]